MSDLFKALADPGRRKILKLLKAGSMNAGTILKHFQMSGASLNHHLTILRQAGLVTSEKKGQNVIYTINTTVFQEILEWIYEVKGNNNEKK
ncbi:MAG: autorepressor SdpR family transcription factor [Spirochaetia bacterium]|nr:autorepressor SdpR family transcription factor [Spirochaetia bacterium]